MRVPSDRPLGSWISDLAANGKLYRFYKTDEWMALRAEVMEDHHFECERCAERGRYRRADTVHHELHVRDYPSMALTRYIDDSDRKHEVLHPLCNDCHNEVHGRKMRGSIPSKPLNEERW